MSVDVLMIPSHSIYQSFMDWEPTESYGMDIDEKCPMETRFSSDVYMAPATVEEVHMASPIPASQPLNLPPALMEIDSSTFFLPPLQLNMKPIVFPPLNIPAASRQTLEHRFCPSEMNSLPLHLTFDIHMPAVLTYQPESPTMASANSQDVTSAVHDHGVGRPVTLKKTEKIPLSVVGVNVPAISCYVPAIPSCQLEYLSLLNTRLVDQDSRPLSSVSDCRPTSKSRTTVQGVSPILTPEPLLDVKERLLRHGQLGDTCVATLDPPIKSTSSTGPPDETVCNDITPNDGELSLECGTPPGWPDWIVEQDVMPSTPLPTKTTGWSNWTVDEDATHISQYPILETPTPFHWPEITTSQEYVDCGVDLIGLSRSNPDIPNSSADDFVLRAFGGSSLEDLDWILEGFRATNVPDTYTEPYDWGLVSETGPDLISFDSAHNLHHRSVETSGVLAAVDNGSFELPSFKSADAIETESNRVFQTSTPAPCDRSVFEKSPLAAEPTLDNMASHSIPEIVIDTYDSQSILNCYPVSDTFDIRHTLRNAKAFKSKLSIKVQKLRVETKTSTEFLGFFASSSQDTRTTTHVGQEIDIEHDVFGRIAEVTDKPFTRSTKIDASTQTEELPDAAYSPRSPRRYSPYARHSPYRKLSRDFTFDSSDSVGLEYTQLTQEKYVTSGTSCGLPSPVDNALLSSSIQGSIISVFELETVCVDQEKEMTFPGAYPIEQVFYASDVLKYTQHIQEESHCAVTLRTCRGLPSPADHIAERELETGLAVRINSTEPEEDDQEKEMTFPGAYPIEQVFYALDEPAELLAKRIVRVAQKTRFEAEVLPCPAVHPSGQCSFKESFFHFFAYLFDW